jgi:hypothetical protein
MITATETGQLIVYVTDDPIDDAALSSAMEMISGEPGSGCPVIIDTSRMQSCSDLAQAIAAQSPDKNIIISDLLESFYDTSILTREAAQILGKVKAMLQALVEEGAQIVVLCRRRAEDLGTRSHFIASLCVSADRVYFRRST